MGGDRIAAATSVVHLQQGVGHGRCTRGLDIGVTYQTVGAQSDRPGKSRICGHSVAPRLGIVERRGWTRPQRGDRLPRPHKRSGRSKDRNENGFAQGDNRSFGARSRFRRAVNDKFVARRAKGRGRGFDECSR